jgi:hypothetical protein
VFDLIRRNSCTYIALYPQDFLVGKNLEVRKLGGRLPHCLAVPCVLILYEPIGPSFTSLRPDATDSRIFTIQ